MNICFVTSTYLPLVGGLEIVVHNLAIALGNLGHNVYVFTPYNRNHTFDNNPNYKIIRFGFRGYGRLKLAFPLAILTLAYVVLRYKIDVINVHNISAPGSWAYYLRLFLKRIPIIGTPHGDDIQITPEIGDGIRLNPELDKIVRRNVNICTRITAISPSVRNDLNELVTDSNKIIGVPNGVWTQNFQTEFDKAETRRKFGVPPDSIAIISVGRNHPRKGFIFALEAVAKLLKDGMSFSYILVGRNMSFIIERARSLGISEFLVTPGEVNADTVSHLLQISDIYVSSSIVESFGLTTLEAMSAGLPCVVTDVAGSRDLVSPDFGLLVEPGKPKKLASAIKYLIDSPSIRLKMGVKARIEAQKYDWPNVARMYLNVYEEALRG